MTLTVVAESGHFGLLQDGDAVNPEDFIDRSFRVVELPPNGDDRIVVGGEVILREYEDVGWLFHVRRDSHGDRYLCPNCPTGMKITC